MKDVAIVLPGAVARGAFEAGVIHALVQNDIKIKRILATSSGALNGLALAVAIRTGKEKKMAEELIHAWLERGSWNKLFQFRPWGIFSGRGLSTQDGLMNILKDMIKPEVENIKEEVELRIIVTPLNGVEKRNHTELATTFEEVIVFTGKDFDTIESLEKVFKTVAAACAFPGLFGSVNLPGLGRCVDGGVVNNAPIKYAVEHSEIDCVFVAIPFPAVMPKNNWGGGFTLLNHLVAILINERLFRDLQIAHSINRKCEELDALVSNGDINEQQCQKIKEKLNLQSTRIVEIRPVAHLNCSPFSPFFFKRERQQLIDEGYKSALAAIQNPTHKLVR